MESEKNRRSSKLYNDALSTIFANAKNAIMKSLPLATPSAVEERFRIVCEQESLRLCQHEEVSESADQIFRRLSTDASEVLEQLQLLNKYVHDSTTF